ncbi:hypothetical protein [Neobacillus sp. SAB-20_R2A]|uniref:hypothetical protein n=1 Tax=Neobacillus sp. SAB-20_R2A TaxID=3120519 RepID=UPI003C6DDB2E
MAVEMLVVQLHDHDDPLVGLTDHADLVVVQSEVETRQTVLDPGSNSNRLGMDRQMDKHLDYMECYSTD